MYDSKSKMRLSVDRGRTDISCLVRDFDVIIDPCNGLTGYRLLYK